MPARGSAVRSSSASGCWATKSRRAWTSRPSWSLLSTVALPVDEPNPRGSQVRTL